MNQSGLPARMAQTSHLGSRAGSDQLLKACAAQGFDTTRPKRNNFIQEDLGGGLVNHLAVDRRSLPWLLRSV